MGLIRHASGLLCLATLGACVSSCFKPCGVSRFISSNRRSSDSRYGIGDGPSEVLLRLVLSPHLLSAHLAVVVHRTSAVRALLVVVHLSRGVNAVVAIGIPIVVLRLLTVRRQAIVRRLPAHSVAHMRAVGGATIMLLAAVRSSRRLKDLGRVVARRWV